MLNRSEPNFQPSIAKRIITITIAGLLISLSMISIIIIKTSIENKNPPILVMRVDDIQDFAFKEAQLFLLNKSLTNHIPLSLAVITGMFGEDKEIVETTKLAVSLGSEATVHGWKHEDLATLSLREQLALLFRAKIQMKETLDVDTTILVPPMFSFSEDTLIAMYEEGYNVFSSSADLCEPGSISKVKSVPATVEMSDYTNGTWQMKGHDSIEAEISRSVQEYGFAVIVTHPQEFISDGKLNQAAMGLYTTLLESLKENYSFKTLGRLGEDRR